METILKLYITKMTEGWTMSNEEITQFNEIQLLYMKVIKRRLEIYGANRNEEG